MKLTYKLVENWWRTLRDNTPILCVRCMRYLRLILNPWRTLPFIAQLHLQPPNIRFAFTIKNSKIPSCCLSHEKAKASIIKPTKDDNLLINKVWDWILSLKELMKPSSTLNYKPISQNHQKEAELPSLESPRPTPATLGRVWRSRVPFLAGTQNYKVVVPSVSFPEHLESHQSEFGRVRYGQNATVAQSSQKIFFCSFSSESVPNYN